MPYQMKAFSGNYPVSMPTVGSTTPSELSSGPGDEVAASTDDETITTLSSEPGDEVAASTDDETITTLSSGPGDEVAASTDDETITTSIIVALGADAAATSEAAQMAAARYATTCVTHYDGYRTVAVQARAIDHGVYRVTATRKSERSLYYHWTGELRASTQSAMTFRDAYGTLITSTYRNEDPRLHQVQRVCGMSDLVLRRLCTGEEVAVLTGIIGCVNMSAVDFSEAFGATAGTINPAPRMMLCSGLRADPVKPGSGVYLVEVVFSTVGLNEFYSGGIGPWDVWVIWADANGVTPPDAMPVGYHLQRAVDLYSASLPFFEYVDENVDENVEQ